MLDAWARELCGMRDMIIDFIDRYEADHHESAPHDGSPRRAGRPYGARARRTGQRQNWGFTTMTTTTSDGQHAEEHADAAHPRLGGR